MSSSKTILRQGANAWRIASAHRAALLIDAASYFETFVKAVRRARRRVFIVGWDIHSRTVLEGRDRGHGLELRELIQQSLDAQPRLDVYILIWDFAMIFALERDWAPIFNPAWSRHPRLHFQMDDHHPVGACHHQKVVVIDDALAFAGGLDLTQRRWDTPEHRPRDSRRTDPSNEGYRPFHDVQIAVDGDAARSLGELARERWRVATGETLDPIAGESLDPWPPDLDADLTDVEVGICRTLPHHEGRPEVREIERLYRDAIAAAEHHIYIENQYFTSSVIRQALEKRLAEARGPEILLILPKRCSGWLEESTMGQLRARVLKNLQKRETQDRLGIFYPLTDGDDPRDVFVHAKVLIIDDRLLRIGSSNASNRSLGFDTECDLVVESRGEPRIAEAIRGFTCRLLADHLGARPGEVAERVEADGSLRKAIEALRGGEKTLEPLEIEPDLDFEGLAALPVVADPEQAVDAEVVLSTLAPEEDPQRGIHWMRFAVVLAVVLALAAAWRWTSLHDLVDVDALAGYAASIRDSPLAPLAVVALYVIASLLMVPVTLQVVATALAFEPFAATIYALAGALTSAAVTFGIGHALGREPIRKLSGGRLNRLSRRLARRGFWAVLATRVLPVAPFTLINLVAGASHIRFRDFALGSLLGLLPGVVAITLLESRLEQVLRHPGGSTLALLASVIAAVGLGWWWLRRRFEDQRLA